MSIAFRGLLTSLRDFIAAERDLEDIAYSQDPAYADWARESEMAFEGLVASAIAIHRLPIECREDRPLHRMALLVDAMLGHEEPDGARALHLQMHLAFFTSFQVSPSIDFRRIAIASLCRCCEKAVGWRHKARKDHTEIAIFCR